MEMDSGWGWGGVNLEGPMEEIPLKYQKEGGMYTECFLIVLPCAMCLINSDPDYLIKCAEIEIYHLGILSYFNFDTQFYRKLGGK